MTPSLNIYVKLFDQLDEEIPQSQRQRMIEVMNEVVLKMSNTKENLYKCLTSFNEVGGKFKDIQIRFDHEYNEKKEIVQTEIVHSKVRTFMVQTLLILSRYFGPGLATSVFLLGNTVSTLTRKLDGIENFYTDLKNRLDDGSAQINDIKSILRKEVDHINDLIDQIENAKTYVNVDTIPVMRDDVINACNELIKHSDDYRRIHRSQH